LSLSPLSPGTYSDVLENTRIRIEGPGRVTKALKIGKRLSAELAAKASGLWIEDRGEKVNPRKIKRLPRVGVAYAEEWKEKPLRSVLVD